MRFVLAIVSFLLAAVMIGYGFAQRTVLAEPDVVSLEASVERDAPLTVIDGAALNSRGGSQTLSIEGSDQIFAAYGRTIDVLGWVGDAQFNLVTVDDETGELVTEFVRGTETEVPSPVGSDLWLEAYDAEDSLRMTVNVPENVSFIVASDGIASAPGTVGMSWPVDNRTPWAGPLMLAGAVVLLIGLIFLVWALIHHRRSGGPRRKQPKMPKVPKRQTSLKAMGSRKAIRPMVVGTALVVAVGLTGCSADLWPTTSSAATPTPTPTVTVPDTPPPAATVRQVERIVAEIGEVAAEADAALDAELLASRFAGPALELREANYTIRAADGEVAALAAIPGAPVEVVLPQQTESWPRTVFTVVQNPTDATVPTVAMFLVQESARENYKVQYAVTMDPAAKLPEVAGAVLGTSRLTLDNPLLSMTPEDIALAYADVLDKDVDSPSYDLFEAEGDSLREAVGLAAKNAAKAALPTTASLTFGSEIGAGTQIIMATLDAGALVAVNLNEITTVAPVEAGAAVNPSGQVKALSGVSVSTKGVTATYGDQLLFYLPPLDSDSPIQLLGYSQGLIAASELP